MHHIAISRGSTPSPTTTTAGSFLLGSLVLGSLVLGSLLLLGGGCGPKHLECRGAVDFRGDRAVINDQDWSGDPEDEADKTAHAQGCARICLGTWEGKGKRPDDCKESCIAESTSDIHCRTVRGHPLSGLR